MKEPTLISNKSKLIVVKGIHTKSTHSLSITSVGTKTDLKLADETQQNRETTRKEDKNLTTE